MVATMQIKQKTFNLGFGMEVFMSLGEIWGLNTFDEVLTKFQMLLMESTEKMPLQNIKAFSEIIEAVIIAGENEETISAKEIRALSFQEFLSCVQTFSTELVKSMPKQEEEPEPSTKKKEIQK